MGARSAIEQLPDDVRQELDGRLVRGGFAGYRELADWLESQGFQVSKSAVHRYGSRFEARLGKLRLASEQARAIVAESPDDEGAVNEALVRLTQERLFGLLMELPDDDENLARVLPKLTRAIAELTRASVAQKKWADEVRAKAAEAAERAETIAKKGGLSVEAAEAIRREILGIAS